MRVLVTGGTGFLGRWTAKALLARGDCVRISGRNEEIGTRMAREGAEFVPSDLRDPNAVLAACAKREVVFHVGALSAPWGPRRDFEEINIGGTANIVAGCRAQGVRRLIYISSPSVVFDGRDQVDLDESAPYPRRFVSAYSETKKRGEDLVNAAQQEMETVILRPKAIFGPGDTSLLPRLVTAAKQGRLPQIGHGMNRVDLTYVENVVDAMLLAGEAPQAVGRTYTITNGESPRLWEVIRRVLGRLGCRTNLRSVPLSAAYAAAALMECRAAITHREPLLTRYSVLILARTQTYDISKARRDLGYAPRLSLAEGIERTVAATET
jgi:nucleoside-diphosphate-sugar epimerase